MRAEEFSDIRTYDAPGVVGDIMLFGKTPEEAAASMMPAILGDGFGQSIALLGHALGFALDAGLSVSHEVAVATSPIDSPIGPIGPGRIAAQKFRWVATVAGEPVVTVATNWFMGQEHLDPAWSFGPEGERFEVEVTGDPSAKVTFHGLAPRVDRRRSRPQPGRGGHGDPLRERHTRGRGGGARHPHLPRPARLLRAGRRAPALNAATPPGPGHR